MTQYLSFVALAMLLAIAPGPDSLLTLRSTLIGGRRRGAWTVVGILVANVVQGVLAASGLGAILMHAETVFRVIKWAGAAYLAYLGFLAIRAAWRMRKADTPTEAAPMRRSPWLAARQGFLCNITNPKVLAFNIAVLPQFVGEHASVATLLGYAMTLSVVGAVQLGVLVAVAGLATRVLQRITVRRSIEGATGVVMLGFAGALVAES
ncbi:threonine efflux protein [Flexivirga endophytica]|uniref:Threonine efflux protein n=1 Tax=Flexivirga endophytica TaxID=1849103 RepID=A0A916WUA2_9MICO|nr:LysE family translocator [Flexivirga endophytica]GGB30323.1 threonine efflux protein [Flexivirga endophytica]GHB51223.1 threonine efflux protein [Flexivirga endophytica]